MKAEGPKSHHRYSIPLPQINMEAHIGPYIEDSGLVRGPSPLPCEFGGVYVADTSMFGDSDPLHTSTVYDAHAEHPGKPY